MVKHTKAQEETHKIPNFVKRFTEGRVLSREVDYGEMGGLRPR